jgi:hypothetical protein
MRAKCAHTVEFVGGGDTTCTCSQRVHQGETQVIKYDQWRWIAPNLNEKAMTQAKPGRFDPDDDTAQHRKSREGACTQKLRSCRDGDVKITLCLVMSRRQKPRRGAIC